MIYRCYGQDCLSSYHVFLLGVGIVAGGYYFATEHMNNEVSIDYAIVDQTRTEKLREVFYSTLLKAPFSSLLPTLSYALVFWICGSVVKNKLSHLLGVDTDDHLAGIVDVLTNGRLLFYAWLLTTQIWSNMHLMRRLYAMLLAEDLPLVMSRNRLNISNEQQLQLVSCLGLSNVHVVQCLAAHFLYKQAKRKDSPMRMEVFQLTEPGNRPANWRALCDQCINIVDSFSEDLVDSMRQISVVKNSNEPVLLAEKVLLRQYNQLHGIRSVMSPPRADPPTQSWQSQPIRHMPNWCERTSLQLKESMQRLLRRIPGIVYLFTEPEGAKTGFLLEHALPVVWVSQAMAQICVASIKEDRYGVVQDDLPNIIKSLHRLNNELDKLNNSIPSLRSTNPNFNYLRCAVRRSLYNICISFYDYLGELIPAGEELRQLQMFVR